MSAQLLLLQSFAIRDVIRSWGGAVHRETANKNSVVLDLLKKKKVQVDNWSWLVYQSPLISGLKNLTPVAKQAACSHEMHAQLSPLLSKPVSLKPL